MAKVCFGYIEVIPNFMKKIIRKKTYLLILACMLTFNITNAQNCQIPKNLDNKIIEASKNENFSEEDFYAINNLLFELETKDSLRNLKQCNSYSQNISELFNSDNEKKRVLAYRLIGVSQDTKFDEELINRINSNESSFLKTWSSTALMANKNSKASDDLFLLFSSFPKGLPVDILLNIYIGYDKISVKRTCWKYIDSEDRNQQILAIQCLSSFEEDEKLQTKLLNFLEVWDNDSKGWVISSISMQKMENLKPLLEKYLNIENLRNVIIQALEKSPTKTDNKFAKQLEKK